MSKQVLLSGTFKRGSSWIIGFTRKDSLGAPVDITGLTTRAMFRAGSVNGDVKFTLDDDAGIVIDGLLTGVMSLKVSRAQSALFAGGDKAYFDIEQTNPSDPTFEWKSLTYYFPVIEQVTRDD